MIDSFLRYKILTFQLIFNFDLETIVCQAPVCFSLFSSLLGDCHHQFKHLVGQVNNGLHSDIFLKHSTKSRIIQCTHAVCSTVVSTFFDSHNTSMRQVLLIYIYEWENKYREVKQFPKITQLLIGLLESSLKLEPAVLTTKPYCVSMTGTSCISWRYFVKWFSCL